jgi:hypothetical protein
MTPEPIHDYPDLTPAEYEMFIKLQDPEYTFAGHEIPVAEFWLEVAVTTGEPADQIHTHVVNARAAGTPWTRIAKIFGVSATTARRRHSHP